MIIAITGSSGLIGRHLTKALTDDGHKVLRMVRHSTARSDDIIPWDPETGELKGSDLENVDAVIHLAGENLFAARWTKKQRRRIYDSRVESARLLCDRLASLTNPPSVYISASGIGAGESEQPFEEKSPDEPFLASVCRDWESAADSLAQKGTRTVFLRLGIVLAPNGGALAKMLPLFRYGLGGRLGPGHQIWSWISIDDVCSAVKHILKTDSLSGPMNMVSPNAVTNREFTKILAKVLRRPAFFPAPAFMLKLLLGQVAEETLLADSSACPTKLLESGFTFAHEELRAALEQLLLE